MYSVIVFDLGNVLIPFDYKPVIDHFNSLKTGLGDKFSRLYAENYYIHQQLEKGELPPDDFISTMLDWLEGKIGRNDFLKVFSEIFTINEELADLLPELKKNFKLVLLSNTNSIHKKFGYGHFGFLNYFDALILSHEVGAIKPEPEIYKAVELFTNEPPEKHFFIDDVEEYVGGAKKAGWGGVRFFNNNQLFEEFRKRGIIK